MTKQMNITVRDSDFGVNAAHVTIAAEGRPDTFRIIPTDRVRMFIQNVSVTAAASGLQANVRDLRKNF